MLVLTRKSGEGIVIGDEIQVKVLAIDGERVKLGIEAPRDLSVHREEVYLEIEAENRKAKLAGELDWQKLKKFFPRA